MFENEEDVVHANGDQSIIEALDTLQESQIGATALINSGTKRFVASIRSNDIHVLTYLQRLINRVVELMPK